MQLEHILIDGFGILSQYRVDRLQPGVNVLYGSNGAGKTTVLQFLRGVFCNFDRARRLRLLPPLRGGRAGGSLQILLSADRYEIIRHARAGHHDTLAIRAIDAPANATAELRQTVASWDRDLIESLFLVGHGEVQSLQELVRLALRDKIELRTTKPSTTWLAERIATVEVQRQDLFGPQPGTDRIRQLEAELKQLDTQLATHQDRQLGEHARLEQERAQLERHLEEIRIELTWLDQELQGVQCDLSETQQRLWSQRETFEPVVETIIDELPPPPILSPVNVNAALTDELTEIEQQISHAQQVLRDLAASRKQISVARAELIGAEVPESEEVFRRQRSAIATVEQESLRLQQILHDLQPTEAPLCQCQRLQTELRTSIASIQKQLSLMCKELSRQQVVSEQMLLNAQRDEVDQCEAELIRQIQRLRHKREHLLQSLSGAEGELLGVRTQHEAAYCECVEHQSTLDTHLPCSTLRTNSDSQAVQQSAPQTRRSQKTSRRRILVSDARSGDVEQAEALRTRLQQLRAQSLSTRQRLVQKQRELDVVRQQWEGLAEDTVLTRLRQTRSNVEQQLADAREQWQSLAMLQTVLQKTQAKLNVEEVPEVIVTASSLFRQMTGGRYHAVRFDDQLQELLVLGEDEVRLPLQVLSRGTLEQAALSFRLALWQEYQRRGVDLPLVLDEVLVESDEQRLALIIDVLKDFFTEDRQLILMTCQEHLANAFESAGLTVRDLPGSRRRGVASIAKRTVSELNLPRPAAVPAPTSAVDHVPALNSGPLVDEPVAAAHPAQADDSSSGLVDLKKSVRLASDRVQPDEPFWLQTDSAVSLVPSLGEQMARRLGAIGVRTVADLIELDPENTDIPLDTLQISAATLRRWQAEGRLLCCVPDLTARDVQVLVLCGIYSPGELAEATAEDLLSRVRKQADEQREYTEMIWLRERSDWPRLEHFQIWILAARRARSYRQAREWSGQRRRRHAAHALKPPHRGNSESTERESVQFLRTGRQEVMQNIRERHQQSVSSRTPAREIVHVTQGTPSVRFPESARQQQRLPDSLGTTPKTDDDNGVMNATFQASTKQVSETADVELRFFLHLDSPIVDAPSIGPKTASRLERIGVIQVSDLLQREAAELSRRLHDRRITPETCLAWQQQATLVCCIPELRGHDAQVLVACGYTDVAAIAIQSPETLFAIVGPFVNSDRGQRLLRSAKTPDLEEVRYWVDCARRSRTLRAA